MEPKPEFLGRQFAASFEDASVAAAYRFRPPFPPKTFEILSQLILDEPRRVLDAGCGTGALARPLVQMAETVDAVDASRAMIEEGKQFANGEHPRLHWILGRIEEVALRPPYSLITAGNSLHWMDWEVVMPRFGELLSRNGVLAIVEEGSASTPWQENLLDIIRRYSIKESRPYHLTAELIRRGLYTERGQQRTASVLFEQPVAAYIESFHARASFPRQRMTVEDAAAFDQAVGDLVKRYEPDMVHLQIYADISWGIPHGPEGV